MLAALLAPFALGRERLAFLVPVCERKAASGRECAFCGMTTSFIAVSEARLRDAYRANRAGPPLYLIFLSNQLVVLGIAVRKGTNLCKR
jgi:uncharacterized protein DUF2752